MRRAYTGSQSFGITQQLTAQNPANTKLIRLLAPAQKSEPDWHNYKQFAVQNKIPLRSQSPLKSGWAKCKCLIECSKSAMITGAGAGV
jgi:hypothetical protein